jgi:hypothetical protein
MYAMGEEAMIFILWPPRQLEQTTVADEGETNPPDTAARAIAVKATAVEDTAARATMTIQIKTITVQL